MLYLRRLLKWLKTFPIPIVLHKEAPLTKVSLLTENEATISRIFPDSAQEKPLKIVEFRADFSSKDAARNARTQLLEIFADLPDKSVYVLTDATRTPIVEINFDLKMIVTARGVTEIEWKFNNCIHALGGWDPCWDFES